MSQPMKRNRGTESPDSSGSLSELDAVEGIRLHFEFREGQTTRQADRQTIIQAVRQADSWDGEYQDLNYLRYIVSRPFTEAERQLIKNLVAKHGAGKWKEITAEFNILVGRNSEQIR
ncbi:hypothetical protein HK097_006434 [Rhizophlyctis rosea]|uniref:Uncharacterized protein n=1 Tax=Rhizophlyctis rosea TaxID=64517 RepID=A0AAD5X6G7_9FUNG|nr:hypothetical protein HK097_006434 [Rhizophlyctis rosea]